MGKEPQALTFISKSSHNLIKTLDIGWNQYKILLDDRSSIQDI